MPTSTERRPALRGPGRPVAPTWALLLLLGALPVAGMVQLQSAWPAGAYLVASGTSVWQYRSDKARAGRGVRRIRERTLHLTALLCGWPGALWAQQRYRHKTRKHAFLAPFWGIVVLHQVLWGAWIAYGDEGAALWRASFR